MANITVAGQVTDGGVSAGILSVAVINIDERTTGATGRTTGNTDSNGDYSIVLSGQQDDQFIVVAKNTAGSKFASSKFWLTTATSYTKDLALATRQDFVLREPPGFKIKVTNL